MKLTDEVKAIGQTVLVLQGGGALGAYQVGVYEALHEAGVAPDWVIGTSIGAINAALIAGSKPGDRIEKMCDFWSRVENDAFVPLGLPSWAETATRNWLSIATGVPSFFSPNPLAFFSPHQQLGVGSAGYYSVDPLRRTLGELVDLDQLNGGTTRITVGASNVRTAEMRYFDSRDMPLGLDHIMASGALPPAFPPVEIDGELFWDGGILSNTPVEVVFDDNPRRDSLVFAVHIWNPHGPAPETIWEVMNRQKDIQYSSRAVSHIQRQRQIHRLRHIIAELTKMLPKDQRKNNKIADLASYGCLTRMHVVRLLAPALDHEDHSKDIDFSAAGIRRRREAGYQDTMRTLEKAPWRNPVDELEGFILHEATGGEMVDTAAASKP
jgi:NTE family protein